jgi:hypothetical protein
MKRQTKLTSQEQEQLAEVNSQQTTAREFASVEEVLRHDAGQTAVPPGIAERLARSVQKVPPPERSWWQRVFQRGN